MSEWFGVILFAAFIVYAIASGVLEGRKWKVRQIQAEAESQRRSNECHSFQDGVNQQNTVMYEALGAIIKENTIAFREYAAATREYAKVMHDRGEKHLEQGQIAALQLQQDELRGQIEGLLKKPE